MKKLLYLFPLVVLCAVVPAKADLVQNGRFEMGEPPWAFHGWVVTTLNPHSGTSAASTGCAGPGCLDRDSGAFIRQELGTTAGQSYDLTFWYDSGRANDMPAELDVYWGDSQVPVMTLIDTP